MESSTILRVALTVISLLLSVAVHEYAHALAAYKLGDDHAARQGRLTLNPLAHADPMGTFVFPIVFSVMGSGVFGWGKPVPYIPNQLTRKFSLRAGEAIIAFAGPFANFIMAFISGALFFALPLEANSPFTLLLWQMIQLNVILFFFNLLPVPPLDGAKVFAWIIGPKADSTLDTIQRSGPMALLVVVLVGGTIISKPAGLLIGFIVTSMRAVFG
jgi:Zn-dependent protease